MTLRPVWATHWVPGQPGLHSETLSEKTKEKKERQKKVAQRVTGIPNLYNSSSFWLYFKSLTHTGVLPLRNAP